MIQIAAYGRLGQAVREIPTSTGKTMAASTLAVDMATTRDEEAEPLWLGVVCFGKVADQLLKHGKGDLISISGRVQRNSWQDRKTGEAREQLQVVADSLVSARSVRPGGKRKAKAPPSSTADLPFNDDLNF